ncbi:proprotein convertase P-domain-containing protein [Hymenobacter lucidus]|uniref:Proprotein convertase P-domain-containing protein n=1 Tax=Hymenobacter lucidus TaxID=2880930 RepID=A0ABS8ATL9_9BACT|nr:proprotein convertase P-domain-containing protein [Hymenobacter lucidus]MCB2409409.1 proprotein convertase P-domain-containing protein [Hymenobacter lucidus]
MQQPLLLGLQRAVEPLGPERRALPRLLGLGTLLLTMLSSQLASAQTIKTLPGDYASVQAAFTDLNTNGVPAGGVTINVAAGYTETPTAALLLTATGTSANPIVFQKSGAGTNPVLTAGVGTTTTLDAIIGLSGADYVTFDGIDVAENTTNTTATTQMEYGYALFRASATDGCQNVSIRNATITLNKANTSTIGIFGSTATAASATAITATSAAGANSNIKLNGNTITSFVGIYLLANTATAANTDTGNEIGTTAGNTLTNLGGANTNVYGIRAEYQNGLKIENNTITIPAGNTSTTIRGIGVGVSTATGMTGTLLINNNTVSLTSATSGAVWGINQAGSSGLTSVTISNNKVQNCALTTTGTVSYIQDASSATALTSTITGNQVTGNSAATTSNVVGIYRSGASGTANIANNTVGTTASGNTVTAANGTFYGIQATTGTITLSGNTISNNTFTASGTAVVTVYGYYNFGSPTAETLTNNIITGLTIAGSSTGTAHILGGLYTNTVASAVKAISGNTIGNLTLGTATGTASGTVTGLLQFLGTTVTIAQNKIYGLTAYGAAGNVTGMQLSSGITNTVANNLIGSLSAPAATGTAAVNGVQISGGTTANLYFNTIYLNAASTSATTFGTSGIYVSSLTPAVDLRNNIVVNTSTAGATGGATVALRYLAAPGTSFVATSNNNLYYAGTPSATQLIYAEGTTTLANAKQTLADYKAYIATRDQAAVTENVPFSSTTGADATFLHINPATATQVESGGVAVTGITTDFDGQTRGTTPDIGADEGTFTPQDLSGPAIGYTALASSSSTANRTLVVTITDPSGVATGTDAPRLYYRKSTSATYVSAVATSISGSAYTFTLDYAALGGVAAGDVIQYYVAAQDNAGNVSTSPVGGSGATPPGSTAPATPASYTIQGILAGVYYVGTGTSPDAARTYPTLTAAVAAYNNSGLGGAVTFLLLDATYSATTGETFPLVLSQNPEASATNTLTIKPNPGVTTTITGSLAAGAILKLNGADYVTIDGANTASGTTQNLTIENTATTGAGNAVVWLAAAAAGDGATFNTVKNTIIRGSAATGTPQFVVFVGGGGVGVASPTTSTPAANSNNTITNNQIQKGYYGLFMFGPSATAADQSNVVSNNQLGQGAGNGFGLEGIRAVYQQNILIEGNEVQNVSNGNSTSNVYGIFLADSKGATLSRNSVHNVSYTGTSTTKAWGIFTSNVAFNTAANASAVTVVNNLVYNINSSATSSTWNTVGINNGGGYGDKYYYNTVYLSGQLSAASGTAGSAAFANGNPSVTTFAANIDVRNNIFSIIGATAGTATTPLYAHYTQATTYAGSTLDNNDLYVVPGTTGAARIGRLNAVDAADLAAWRTATTQEANSVSADPGFAQTTTVPYLLKPSVTALNGAGVAIAGISVDYLGTTRTSPPDIGAYEFTPIATDLVPVALLTPSASTTCYGFTEAVSVSIRNAGSAAIDFTQNPATVTVAVTPPGGTVQTLTATITTGTLASGATQTVALTGTVDMTTVGAYSFVITATVQGDGNTSNDVLAAVTRTVVNATPTQSITAPAAACVDAPFTIAVASNSAAGSIRGTQAPALAIPDNALTGASSTITLSGAPATATISAASTVRVTLNITHTYDGDLDIYLVGPGDAGTLELSTDNGAAGANYTNTVLATGTTGAITTGTAPFTGTYAPEGAIATAPTLNSGTGSGTYTLPATALNGVAINGDWKLYVYDDATGDTGTLLNWSLTIADPAIPSTTITGPGTVSAPVVSGGTSTFTVTGAPTGSNAYVVTTVTPAGCSTSATQSVNVTALPTASLTAATAQVCAGTTYQLAGTVGGSATGGTYTSSGTGTFSPNATTLNAVYTPSAADITAGSVVLTLTTTGPAACSAATASTTLTINPATTATFSYSGGTFCLSGINPTPTITGTAGGTFSSTAGLSLDAATGAINLASSSTGTYVVTYSVGGSCPSSSTASVTITAAPSASFSYATATYCAGSSATVAPAFGSGSSAGSFTVSPATGLTINATTGVITLSSSTAGTYTITNTIAASGGCASATAAATVTITAAPVATLTAGGATTFCQGGAVVLSVPTATGSTYQFLLNGTAITGATSATYTATASGSYSVTVTNAGGCSATSAATTVTVNPTPATPTLTLTGLPNGAVQLNSSAATGNQFYRNGVLIPGATGQTYLLLSSAQNGSYTVVTTGTGGCASAPSNTLTVVVTASGTTSLAGVSSLLYPNPSQDGNVTLELRGYTKATQLTLFNSLGQVVRATTLHPEKSAGGVSTLPVDLSALPAGMYWLRLSSPDTGLQTLKLVRE